MLPWNRRNESGNTKRRSAPSGWRGVDWRIDLAAVDPDQLLRLEYLSHPCCGY
jgi:hypothetical protein